MDNRFFKIMLIITAILLAQNLLGIRPSFKPAPAIASGGSGQITCSSDGQYVYIFVNGMYVFMSDDYGKSFRQQTQLPRIIL